MFFPWNIQFNKHNSAGRNLWLKVAGKAAQGDLENGPSDNSREYIRFSV
jgi:hypothetical protein